MLIGKLTVSPTTDKAAYVCAAFDEINSRIGYLYTLPIVVANLEIQSQLVLKKINNFIASGRFIMAMAIGAEQQELHAYGASLVREGFAELALILDGSLPLIGAEASTGTVGDRFPETVNHDAASAMYAFEDEFFNESIWDHGTRVTAGDDESLWFPGGTPE